MEKPKESTAPSAKGKNEPLIPLDVFLQVGMPALQQSKVFRLALIPVTKDTFETLKSDDPKQVLLAATQLLRNFVARVGQTLNDANEAKVAFREFNKCIDLVVKSLSRLHHNLPNKTLWQYFEVIIFITSFLTIKEVQSELLPIFITTLDNLSTLYKSFLKLLLNKSDKDIETHIKISLQKIDLMLAENYSKNMEWGKAKTYYKKSYQAACALKLDNKEDFALEYEIYCSQNVIVAIKRGKIRKARQYAALCESALQASKDYGLKSGKNIQEAYQEIGLYYLKQGNLDFALYWYQRALDIPIASAHPKIQIMINTTQKRLFAHKREKLTHLAGLQIESISCQWNENNFTLNIIAKNDAVMAIIQEILDKHLVEYRVDEQNKLSIAFNILPVNMRVFYAFDDKLYKYHQACLAATTPAQPAATKKEEETRAPEPKPMSQTISAPSVANPTPAVATKGEKDITPPPPIPQGTQTYSRIIKWADARFPDTNLDQLDELTGELFHPDKKDHSIVHVNESAFPKKSASILLNKVKNKLDNGKVIPDNTKNQEGFMLFSQRKPKQDEFKKLGENCHGKLKILGNMGKARFPLMWATQGKLYKDGKETDTVYQRYEISEVVEKSHRQK